MEKEKEEILVSIARATHEINRIYCAHLGDASQPRWERAPEWQKKSAFAGIRTILEHPEIGPEQQHESWLRVKEKDGWRYGEKKDEEKKTHPCFVPFEKLPYHQKAKDMIFGAVVRGLAEGLGILVELKPEIETKSNE
jgi:hypothetical protein